MSNVEISKDSKNTMITDFTEGNVTKKLILFATPLFLSNFLQIVYNMVDMVVVGQVLGSAGLSAISIGGDISNFLAFVVMGFSNAGQIIISQYIGADQKENVGKFIGTMFSFLISCALILTVVCLMIREHILYWMNTPMESWNDALSYATTCIIGLVFVYGYNIVSAVLRGMGDSKHPFIFISIAAVLNLVLDIWFVAGLHLGAFGAALATIISQTVSFISSIIFLYQRHAQFGFDFKLENFRIDFEMLTTLVRLGVPMAIKSAAIHFSKLFVNSWINSYGVIVSAVAGIGNKLNSISNLISNSINTAGSSMVGQNIGAEKYKRVPKIMIVSFAINLSISTLIVLALTTFPNEIFGIFASDTSILHVAMEYLPIAVLIFFGSTFRSPMNALINGSGNYKINFAVAILDGIVLRIGLALLLGLACNMDYLGFWYGDALAGFTPFIIGLVYYFSGTWRTRKYVIKNN